MKHIPWRMILISTVPALIVFFVAFFWVSYHVNTHKHDSVYSGEEFLAQCRPYNFAVDGNLLTSTGDDPQLIFDCSGIPAYKYILVTVSDLSESTLMQVYWSTSELGYREENSYIIRDPGSVNVFFIPKIKMGGGINEFRFDLARDAGISMQIDSVVFTNSYITWAQMSFRTFFAVAVILILFNILIAALGRSYYRGKIAETAYESDIAYPKNKAWLIIGMILPVIMLLLNAGIYIYRPLYLIFGNPAYTANQVPTNKPVWILENVVIAIPTVIILIIILFMIRNKRLSNDISDKLEKVIATCIILAFSIFIYIGKLSLFTDYPRYDVRVVREGMMGIMNDRVIPDDVQSYLQIWPNNRFIIFMYGFLGTIAKDLILSYRKVWLIVDSILVTLSLIFSYLTVRLFVRRKVSVIILILTALFLAFSAAATPNSFSSEVFTLYTDSAVMPFTMMSVYFFAKYFKNNTGKNNKKSNIYILAGSISSAIGSLLKPTALVTVIAFVLILLIQRVSKENTFKQTLIRLFKKLILVAVGICIIVIPFEKIFDRFDTRAGSRAEAVTLSHYLVIGLPAPPTFNPFLYRQGERPTTSSVPMKEIGGYIKEMNPALIPVYYVLKDVYNFTFPYRFDSDVYSHESTQENFYKTPFLESFRDTLLNINIPIRAVLFNVMLLTIGIWAFFVLKKKTRLSSATMYLSMTLLGAIGYLTLFEGGDRYVMQFWPLLFVLSGLGLNDIEYKSRFDS